MSHTMKIQSFSKLLHWILDEYKTKKSIFSFNHHNFYFPKEKEPYMTELNGRLLATPLGPAAGPHTQLAQNIIISWLAGSRFIELKTVQENDSLEIARPCIDMADEGYNVEWSQELKLEQSADEYIKAWAIIHLLPRIIGSNQPVGTIFNMSIGYNLEGILSAKMQKFMSRMENAKEDLDKIRECLKKEFPQFVDIDIPEDIVNSVTMSTMHGCPPEEIGKIAIYLMKERKLHTTVKLNPTLLGQKVVLECLNEKLGYKYIDIPKKVFAHDLQYKQALTLIKDLKKVATENSVEFSLKLTNTLAMPNHKQYLPGEEMYMSGRALYPLAVMLYQKIRQDLDFAIRISFSAGIDALNIAQVIEAGVFPVTLASDILKPGGYGRLGQCLENLKKAMIELKATSLQDFVNLSSEKVALLAENALSNVRYHKDYVENNLPKTKKNLTYFDCITAPCRENCAVCQDIPTYAWHIASGDYDQALMTIVNRNPLPLTTSYICTEKCKSVCTRHNYDLPVSIRELKKAAAEKGKLKLYETPKTDIKVAVIGAGPAGLAAAFELSFAGVQVIVFEARDRAGGMMAIAPSFRLPKEAVLSDFERIRDLGIEFRFNTVVTAPETYLEEGFSSVFVGCGLPFDAEFAIEGKDGDGVLGALELLERVAGGENITLGHKVLVIGGGNTAMDAARTAQRLSGQPVTVVYRRTQKEMPAIKEEITALLNEGNEILELTTPLKILKDNKNNVYALECLRNRLGKEDESGRRSPETIEGSNFQIEADTIILAIGQQNDALLFKESNLKLDKNGRIIADENGKTNIDKVYAGGDIVTGPAIVIEAIAEGRKAAQAIISDLNLQSRQIKDFLPSFTAKDVTEIMHKRIEKHEQAHYIEEEAKRCLQCSLWCDKCIDVCPNRANVSIIVTPLTAKMPVLLWENKKIATAREEIFTVKQAKQVIHLDDFCNECGNCATFCLHQGKPYLDKPRLFLEKEDFLKESDNAFYLELNALYSRNQNITRSIKALTDGFEYEDNVIKIHFEKNLKIKYIVTKGFEGEKSLVPAVEMLVLMQGIATSLSYMV